MKLLNPTHFCFQPTQLPVCPCETEVSAMALQVCALGGPPCHLAGRHGNMGRAERPRVQIPSPPLSGSSITCPKLNNHLMFPPKPAHFITSILLLVHIPPTALSPLKHSRFPPQDLCTSQSLYLEMLFSQTHTWLALSSPSSLHTMSPCQRGQAWPPPPLPPFTRCVSTAVATFYNAM